MSDQLTAQQTIRLAILAGVAARDILALLNVTSMMSASMRFSIAFNSVRAIDAELSKISAENARG